MSIELDVYAGLPERVAEGRAASAGRSPGPKRCWSATSASRAWVAAPERGRSYVDLDPDRVALQDALAQIVALQFMTAGLDEVVVPTTVHCDHLITARTDADVDLRSAQGRQRRGLRLPALGRARSSASASGNPGAGIIHQVVLENYAFPGGMMIGTDSHTPNAGGLGDGRGRRRRRRRDRRDDRTPLQPALAASSSASVSPARSPVGRRRRT